MHRLPPLTAGQAIWRLPWSDPHVAAAAEALLADSPETAQRRWLQLLRSCPTLLLWALYLHV